MARARIGSQSGFTLVEVMVAISVLLIGVLGAVTLIDGANAQTSRTKAREGATALARSVLEVARGVPYPDLTSERVLAELDARGAGFADSSAAAPGHQVKSRGFVYTVAPAVCSMDDPKDSLGAHDEVGVTFCADSDVLAGSPGTVDRNPDDYRRVAIDLTWRVGSGSLESTVQTGIVTNPVGGLGPSVLALTPRNPATPSITGVDQFADYDILTSAAAEDVALLVNGNRIASAVGEGVDWDFSWDLGDVNTPQVYDCTYVLQAQAFDDKARAGAPYALTVTVNRRRPFAPVNFQAGANLRGAGRDVDLQWDGNVECDIQRYVVYRDVEGGPAGEVVCEVPRDEKTECVDESPPAGDLTYRVVGFDVGSDGVEHAGDPSPEIVVPDPVDNAAPDVPAPLAICTGGQLAGDCEDIEGTPAPDGTAVLSWPPVADPDDDGDAIRFYRIYRAGPEVESPGYEHRLNVLFPVFDDVGDPVTPHVFVDETATGPHKYWVTAVDERFGESEPSGGLLWGAP